MNEAQQTDNLPPLLLGKTVLELARAIDLHAVIGHDNAAVQQLENALTEMVSLIGAGSMKDIAFRRVAKPSISKKEVAPAVDVMEPAPTGGSLAKALGGAGLAQHLGHVYIPKRKPPLQPLKTVPDITGLPMFQACIAPSWSPIDGAHGIFITGSSIITAVYPLPFENNRWHVRESHSYDSREEMIQIVQDLMTRKG